MKHLRRRLFNSAAVVSFTISVTTAVMWVLSYWHTHTLSWNRNQRNSYFISSHRGRLEIVWQSVDRTTGQYSIKAENPAGIDVSQLGTIYIAGRVQVTRRDGGTMQATRVRLSFDPHDLQHVFWGAGWTDNGVITVFAIPDWALLVLFGGNAAFAAWRFQRARLRPLAGHCPTCGYDLRATPDRCPECGAMPKG